MFVDRRDAGVRLGERLHGHVKDGDPIVLGLPRGGVVVAFEVAAALNARLDVIVVRKLGVPFHPELGFGAIGEEGVRVLNTDVVEHAGLTEAEMAAVERRERAELERRAARYRGGRPAAPLEGRTAIVVDDGVATGGTMRAACQVAQARGAARVIAAVPVGAPEAIAVLRRSANEVICLRAPRDLFSIGSWYSDFAQTTDDEVTTLLTRAASPPARHRDGPHPAHTG